MYDFRKTSYNVSISSGLFFLIAILFQEIAVTDTAFLIAFMSKMYSSYHLYSLLSSVLSQVHALQNLLEASIVILSFLVHKKNSINVCDLHKAERK